MIYRAGYVLPMDGRVIADGEVLVRGGEIAEVGRGIARLHPHEEVRDLGQAALLPGFVNAHCHIEPTFMRGRLDGLNLWDWISALGFRGDSAPSGQVLAASALVGAIECARSGITCLGDASYSGGAAALGAVSAVGLRAVVYREIFGQSMGSEYRARFARALDEVRSLQLNTSPLVTIGLSPHSVYASNPEVLGLCADVDVPVCVHLAETAAETDYCLRGEGPIADMRSRMGYEPMVSGLRPVGVLREAGLLKRGVCLAHCVHVSDEEIRLTAGSGASVAHCARSNAYLGAGAAPVPRMLDAGGVVGLGTDSAASCLRLDFFEEMRFALGIHRALAQEAGVLRAKDALTLATVGGARALGLADRIGTLETGKRADMVAVDLRGHLPGEDVFVSVVRRGPSDVVMALVDGEEIVREGRPTRVDIAEAQAALSGVMEQQS